ncbi:MAG: hypothetical protein EAX90_13165 [Candidatus Heimdallarchaeota archaeon]|nr:hypothetical protein [Candidatus Heimdallarchaeota archaeon]
MTWLLEDSKLIYGTNRNDLHYLDINENGKLILKIDNQQIAFEEIVKIVRKKTKYKKTSFALRIPQLIIGQIRDLISSFENARKKFEYSGKYQPIYPIKVNSQKLIIETIIKSNPNYAFEAGTKSEFILLLHALENEKNRLIMCNGAKDQEYLKEINEAIKKGHNVCISIETILEIKDTLKLVTAGKYQLALRIKPYVKMHGHWGESSGRHSKFGLSIAELIDVVKIIIQKKKAPFVTMLHAHPGSQMTNLPDFYKFAEFMSNTFRKLKNLGLNSLSVINFGGGLPIDYDNSLESNFMERYAEILVESLKKNLPEYQPDICTESGRAITATSTMIMVNIIEQYNIFPNIEPIETAIQKYKTTFDELISVRSIDDIIENWSAWEKISDGITDPDDLLAFEFLSIKMKKEFRKIFYDQSKFLEYIENPIIKCLLLSEYSLQGNFSVFNSIADYVLVHQYFPVIPISHLHKQPETLAHLYDITCDSDGKVASYHTAIANKKLFTQDGFLLTYPKMISLHGFPIGNLREIVNNYLLIPLAGAYQDIIEFNHNLLGDLPDILIAFDGNDWIIEQLNGAQSIGSLLAEVGYTSSNIDDPYMDQEQEE